MIHPDRIDSIAAEAYGRFTAKYPGVEWPALPGEMRIKWRDNVVAADRVRNKTTDVFQEQCVFDAVMRFYAPASVEEPALAPAGKPNDQPKPKRK